MKVLWFTNSVMPAALRYLGRPPVTTGPWMWTLLDAMAADPQLELCVVTRGIGLPTVSAKLDNVQCEVIGHPRRVAYWTSPRDYLEECAERVRRWRPDVVHVHGTEMDYGMLVADRWIDVPAVISLQGLMGPIAAKVYGGLTPLQRLRSHTAAELVRNTGLFGQSSRYRKAAARERYILGRASVILGRTACDRAYTALLNPSAQYHHVDELMRPAFYRREWALAGCNRHSIIFTNCGAALKGLETLLDAVRLLVPKYPDISVRLAGRLDSGTGYGRYVLRYISRLRLESQVAWLGFLDEDEIVRSLARSHIYVTTTHVDNSPNSLTEALLMGMPAVASDVGGIPSLITPGETGLMFPAGDAATLADRIDSVFASEPLAVKLGSAARGVALHRHAKRQVLDQLMSAYRAAVAGHGEGDRCCSRAEVAL